MSNRIRLLVVGCGHMGTSHALAYRAMSDFEIVGVVSRGPDSRRRLSSRLGGVPEYDEFSVALESSSPGAVSINTYPDTHAAYTIRALESGAHVFVEKPLGVTVEEARSVVEAARSAGKKVVVGYILRHHPSWAKFTEIARTLGKPLVMRMNLNQQSSGPEWVVHKNLMRSLSPIVDCGVHYLDVMCQMTGARPVRVQATGARLSPEIAAEMYNYGHLQVVFEDGSIGWYEAGWGPMISETAFFVKDVIGPRGCVSLVSPESASSDVGSHTKAQRLLVHSATLDEHGDFSQADKRLDMSEEPDHQELCNREQAYFLKAIREDMDLSKHWEDAVNSLRIVLAADLSVRTGRAVDL